MAEADLEVRAYVGFGSTVPEHLVRIVRRGSRVSGEILLWWPGTTLRSDIPDDPERPIAQQDQELWARAMRERARGVGCGPVRRGGWVETCVLEQGSRIDWARVLADLESGGITHLEGGRRTPRAAPGTSLYVQVCAGNRPSAHAYSDPRHRTNDPDERAAARLLDMLLRLF